MASEKMPDAKLYLGDLTDGLAEPLKNQKYDFIIATYVLHHLTDEQKVVLLKDLLGYLKEGGKILIGDVAFETREKLDQCRQEAGDDWDDDEIYIVAEELRKAFPVLTFTQISFCAGILTLAQA